MAESTITSKYQTTVPREVRERLGIGRGDVLLWEVEGRTVRLRPAGHAFLDRRGSVEVGLGSPAADVRQARRIRGLEEP